MVAARALENVIHEISPDDIWFLGDAVGKGPQSDETCDWVREHCRHFIGGNWDYGIADKAFPADEYFWNQLGPERMQWLSALPSEAELMLSGIRFRLFHGRPVTPLLVAAFYRERVSPLAVAGAVIVVCSILGYNVWLAKKKNTADLQGACE